jgi:hypothetical protein
MDVAAHISLASPKSPLLKGRELVAKIWEHIKTQIKKDKALLNTKLVFSVNENFEMRGKHLVVIELSLGGLSNLKDDTTTLHYPYNFIQILHI